MAVFPGRAGAFVAALAVVAVLGFSLRPGYAASGNAAPGNADVRVTLDPALLSRAVRNADGLIAAYRQPERLFLLIVIGQDPSPDRPDAWVLTGLRIEQPSCEAFMPSSAFEAPVRGVRWSFRPETAGFPVEPKLFIFQFDDGDQYHRESWKGGTTLVWLGLDDPALRACLNRAPTSARPD